MKTLDEVITGIREEMGLGDPVLADALHYLKEYRNCGACAYADSYLRCTKEYRNDPLTWDELRQMEGKPVWVEPFGAKALHTPGWGLVGNTSFTTWEGVQCCAIVKVGMTYALPVAEYGKTWQAYRKERSE